jgi:uncharacterized protein YcbK (DUF882 family)
MFRCRLLLAAGMTLLLAAPSGMAWADEGAEEGSSGGSAGTESAAAAAAAAIDAEGVPPVRKVRKRSRRGKSRAKFAGRVVPENLLRDEPLVRPSGNIDLVMLAEPSNHAKVNIYNKDGSYNLEAMDEINEVLRCRRTDETKPMDPQLLTYLSHIYDHFGGKPLQVVSGFRNQRKQTSNHFKGTATDIRIPGVGIRQLKAFVETLDRGGMGIGIYPRTGFVHVDVRSPPSYRWTDYSGANSNAAEKRPPRGWKRKKLQS